MLYLVLVGGGVLAGLVVRRWWLLVVPAGLGMWVGLIEEVVVPGWFLGLAYGALGAAGVAVGVLVGRVLTGRREGPDQPPT